MNKLIEKLDTILKPITYGVTAVGLLLIILCSLTTSFGNGRELQKVPAKIDYIQELDDGTLTYHFDFSDVPAYYDSLVFFTTHDRVRVYNGTGDVYRFDGDGGFWTISPGSTYHFLDLVELGDDFYVEITPVYDLKIDVDINFYVGDISDIVIDVYRKSIFNFTASVIIIILSILLLTYYFSVAKRQNLPKDMLYLASFSMAVGIWAINETDIMTLIVKNKIFDTMIPYFTIMLMVPSLVMFIYGYLGLNDKYIHNIIIWANNIQFVVLSILHFTHVYEYKQSLYIMQIMLLVGALYVFVAVLHKTIKKEFSRRLRICTIGLGLFLFAVLFDLYTFYRSLGDSDVFGRYMYIIFMMLLSFDIITNAKEAIEKGKRAKELEVFAITDQMTGMYNRNAYETHVERLQNLEDLVVVECDLNSLKYINDTYGHEAGDEYITTSSKIITDIFGPYGNCYRIGGDEFCCILNNVESVNMEKLIRNLRQKCSAIKLMSSQSYEMNIAIGYARFDEERDLCFSDIVKRADIYMYENKRELKGKL